MPELCLLTSLPSIAAELLAGALRAEGIEVVLERPALGVVYRFESGPWATRVLVPADELDRARTLLAEFDAPEG